jgi:hypothetical protein
MEDDLRDVRPEEDQVIVIQEKNPGLFFGYDDTESAGGQQLQQTNITTYKSSNRSWAYTGENFILPSASKLCPRRNPTTTFYWSENRFQSK